MHARLAFGFLLGIVGVATAQTQALQPGELSGDWRATDKNKTGECQLSLEVSTDSLGYRAYAFGCTGPDLHRAAGWRLRGTAILLTDSDGNPLLMLKMKDRTHFEGVGPSGVKVEIFR